MNGPVAGIAMRDPVVGIEAALQACRIQLASFVNRIPDPKDFRPTSYIMTLVDCLCQIANLESVKAQAEASLEIIRRKAEAARVATEATMRNSKGNQLVMGWGLGATAATAASPWEARLGRVISTAESSIAEVKLNLESARKILFLGISPADRLLTNSPLGLKVLFVRHCQLEGRTDFDSNLLDMDIANLYRSLVISCYHEHGDELEAEELAEELASIAYTAGFDTVEELNSAPDNLCDPCKNRTRITDMNIYVCGSCVQRVQTSWPEFQCPGHDDRGARCTKRIFLNNQLQVKYPDRVMYCADCHKKTFGCSWKAERKEKMKKAQLDAVIAASKKKGTKLSRKERRRIEKNVRRGFFSKKKKRTQMAQRAQPAQA